MISLEHVNKTYRMGSVDVCALSDVSVTIESGEFVAIMGPSGSGKSTLMHVIGLLDRPEKGVVTLLGTESSSLSDEQRGNLRNRSIGFIFQQFHLLPRLSALENVELPLVYAGKRHMQDRARACLSTVGLTDRMTHRPNELSGGQQQRVAIARALVNDPPIILADEPTGNLDSASKQEIMDILEQLNTQGKTILIVTHEPEVAERARRIIRVRDGVIVSDERRGPAAGQVSPSVLKSTTATVSATPRGETMKWGDYLRQAFGAMVSHRLRSGLSILGVLIGVAAVVAMLALGEGAKTSIREQLASLGSNLLMIRPGSAKVHGVSLEAGSVTRFTLQDVDAIRAIGDDVTRISPSVQGKGQVVYGNKNWNTQIEGVDTDYEQMRACVPIAGRFFSHEEVVMREKVALLGTTVARELFGTADPVGESIRINQVSFYVIGVLPSKGARTFRDQDDIIVVPVTTAMYRLLGKQYVDSIYVEGRTEAILDPLTDRINEVIRRTHRLSDKYEDTFQIRNMADIRTALESTTRTMSMLLGAIAAISLVVGGIGVMNIMLVSVTERTREIGLRKAIGATDHDIRNQFLIEAVVLSVLGGLSGVVVGAVVSGGIIIATGWAVRISLLSIVLSTTFSLLIGIVFGLWPARQASELDPIVALRYE